MMADVLYWLVYATVAFTLVMWIGRLVLLSIIEWLYPPLRPDPLTADDSDLPSLSVLVAAKDEARNIESCVRSLLRQDYPRLEVICVDDRSTDGTYEILRRLAAEDARVRIARVSDLPAGWFGKNHAMHVAVSMARNDWYCFTDADCTQSSPRSLATGMRRALREQADFLSVLPSHEAHFLCERIVQPACSAVMMLWFSPMAVNRGRVDYANGAFMLMHRPCYRAIGGHEAVRAEVNEDIHMARRARIAGQRLVVVAGRDLYTVRMYDTFARIWSGWTRIFVGSFTYRRRIGRAAFVLFYFTFLPWMGLATALSPGWRDWSAFGVTTLAAASSACQIMAMMLFYRLSRVHPLYGLLYPLGGAVAFGTLLNALRFVSAGGSFKWRGTRYRAAATPGNIRSVDSAPAPSVMPGKAATSVTPVVELQHN